MRRLVPFVLSCSLFRVLIVAALAMLAARAAPAATRVWSGAGANVLWSNTTNWVGGVVPASGDQIVFPSGTAGLTNFNDLLALRPGPVTFGGTDFNLSGNSVTNDGGIKATNASGINVWRLFTTLGSNQTYSVSNRAATLNIAQTLSLNGKTLTLTGPGTNVLSAVVADFVGGGGIICTGDAKVTMTGTNSFTGSIALYDGTLLVNGIQSNSPVVFAGSSLSFDAGTLTGTGTVASITSTSTVATLHPGVGDVVRTGALRVQGDLRLFHGTLLIDITGTGPTNFGQLIVEGVVALTNSLQVVTWSAPPPGTAFTIIDNRGTDAVQGTFGLPEGDLFLSGGTRYRISYVGGSGNDVVITAVSSNRVWSGAGANGFWSTGANWVGGVAPTNNDDVTFPPGAARLVNTNNLNLQLRSLVIGGSNYVIRGNALNMVSSGTAELYVTNTVGTNTIEAPWTGFNGGIVLSNINPLATLMLNGPIDLAGGWLLVHGNGSTRIAGSVTNSSALNGQIMPHGPGLVELRGTNFANAEVDVAGGTLLVNGLSPHPVLLLGGTIGGTGTIGTLSCASGNDTISPGNSPGILNCSNVFWRGVNTSFAVELNGTTPGSGYDQLNVSGTVNLSNAVLNVSLGFFSVPGDSFTIIRNDGTDAVASTFASLPEGAALTLSGGTKMSISYHGGDGNDVVLTTLPFGATGNTKTWNGAGTNGSWSNGSNWVGNIAPSQGDDLLFPPSAARRVNTNDFPAASTFNSISFSDGNYVCRGNLVLLNAGVSNTVVPGAGAITVALPLRLAENQSFVVTGLNTPLNLVSNIDSNGRILTFNVAGTMVVSGSITGGGAIINSGFGVVSLLSSNSYLGSTTINAGIVIIADGFALGTTGGDTFVGQFGLLTLTSNITVAEPLTIAGALGTSDGTNTVTSRVVLAGNPRISSGSSSSRLILSGIVTGSGSFNQDGLGTVVLSGTGTNDFTGPTLVRSGVLLLSKTPPALAIPGDLTIGDGLDVDVVRLTANNQIATNAGIVVNESALFDLAGHFQQIGALEMTAGAVTTGAGQLTVTDDVFAHADASAATITGGLLLTAGSTRNFNIDPGATMTIFARIDSLGGTGLTKNGLGKLVLQTNNFYFGATRINAGVVEINGAQTNNPISLAGGTLDGIGYVGPITSLAAGGTISPGASPGILGARNCLFNSATMLIIELNGLTPGTQYDQLSVTGTVNLASATLDLHVGFAPAVGTTFTIINNDGSDAITGTFAGLTEGSTITAANGSQFRITYQGGSQSNDVVLTTAFQPGTGVARIWDGGGTNNNWTTPQNWVGDVAPNPGDDLAFPPGAVVVLVNNDFAAGTTFNSIAIGGTNYALVGNSMLLNAGLITTNVSGINRVRLPFTLQADQTFAAIAASGSLEVDAIDLNGKALTLNSVGQINVRGAITGTTGLIKMGTGFLELDQTNFYAGITEIREGTLVTVGSAALGSAAAGTTVFPGATLLIGTAATNAEPLTLSGQLNYQTGTNRWTGPIQLIGTNAVISGFSLGSVLIVEGLISGNGGFQKPGAGKLVLNANNTYSGPTIVAGTQSSLFMNGSQPQSSIIVSNFGTLGGTGVVGAVTGQQGVVAPGARSGILSCSNLNLDISSALNVDISGPVAGTGYDQLRVSGSVQLDNASLHLNFGYTPATGDSFKLIDNDGVDSIAGSFFGFSEGQIFTNAQGIFQITYQGGSGNDLVITRFHPPSTINSIVCDTNGFKQIQGLGEAGLTYTIQATTNLAPVIQWINLGPAAADGSGIYQFIDMDALIYRERFYRAVSP